MSAYTLDVMDEAGLWTVEIEPEVQDWLSGLALDAHSRVDLYVCRLAEDGPSMRMPRSRPLGDGLYELRFQLGDDDQRITYWFAPGHRVVLLTQFRKTRMNEADEIARARRARQNCKDRHPPAEDHNIYQGPVRKEGGPS